MKRKFIRKYMRIARLIGEDDNPCYSRQIGAIIVDPTTNTIRGTGYNGPPPGTPHTDSASYLRRFFWPQLTESEKQQIASDYFNLPEYGMEISDDELCHRFVKKFTGCKTCPRRLVKAASGQRNELCSCGHAERHAITNASCAVHGFTMFCWCTIPCIQCADAIIQAGIKTVHCLDEKLYHTVSEWMLRTGGVEVIQHKKEIFHDDYVAPPPPPKPEPPPIEIIREDQTKIPDQNKIAPPGKTDSKLKCKSGRCGRIYGRKKG